ncbi:MAG: hypothetical protein HPY81_00235 [Firmicutes bacterium]|nr:hypothetical protein [Bacillota bacterium]
MSHHKKDFKHFLKRRIGDPVSLLLKNGARVNGILEKVKHDYVVLGDVRDPRAVRLDCICEIAWRKSHCR